MMLQGVVLRTNRTQPEMFNAVLGRGKSEEPSSVETHQQLGAVRVGTLGDHSFAAGSLVLGVLLVHIL
jgi:hypothetical protein